LVAFALFVEPAVATDLVCSKSVAVISSRGRKADAKSAIWLLQSMAATGIKHRLRVLL
jgi:hypothetical protein